MDLEQILKFIESEKHSELISHHYQLGDIIEARKKALAAAYNAVTDAIGPKLAAKE